MCTGRVDLAFIFRAFFVGNDGVFVGGCRPGECHYSTEGNYHALSLVHLCKKLLELIGLSPERLRLEWVGASEGTRFAEIMNDFAGQMKRLGPLGSSEGMDDNGLKSNLEAIDRLIPYVKLVERERLRVRFKTEEEYGDFFAGDEVNRIFKELIADKLAVSRMVHLLRENPLSTDELAEILALSPSEVSRHLACSARQGLLSFDKSQKRFALA